MNGVAVKRVRLFDSYLPWQFGHPYPNVYESTIVENLRKHTQKGDSITIIGGGWGVTTVIAAQESGPSGEVITYEASPQYARYVRETADTNGVGDQVEVQEAVVSFANTVRGNLLSENVISPSGLEPCDILELDCEGAEIEILESIEIRPRVIIVESHGQEGAPSKVVAEKLESLSYKIVNRKPAEGGERADLCREKDVYVLTALRESTSQNTE